MFLEKSITDTFSQTTESPSLSDLRRSDIVPYLRQIVVSFGGMSRHSRWEQRSVRMKSAIYLTFAGRVNVCSAIISEVQNKKGGYQP